MRKGEATRAWIISKSAGLFNSRGFAGTPLSEVLAATGLKKGGIYNHFESKEEIRLAAFDYAIGRLISRIETIVEQEDSATAQLRAILEFYRGYALDPVIEGGCPLLNSIIDSDNTDPPLKSHVQRAINELQKRITFLFTKGVRNGELKRSTDPEREGTLFLALIEGGVALCRGSDEQRHMDVVIDMLLHRIEGMRVEEGTT